MDVTRDRLIEVCSGLLGKKIQILNTGGKEFTLASADGIPIAVFPKQHNSGRDSISRHTQRSVLRAVANGDSRIYEMGKRMLRSGQG
jgi:hypothetical protein